MAQSGARWAELGERGALWGMRFVLAAHRILGRRGTDLLLVPIVGWFWLTGGARRRISLDYLRRVRALAGQPPPRWWHGLAHWLGFARKALDGVLAAERRDGAGPVRVEDPDGLAALAAVGRGGMILVAHVGNPDVARAALAGQFGSGLTVLMHTRHAANYNRMLDRLHGSPLSRTLEVTELGPAVAMDLQQRVERGEWLAMAADRAPVDPNGRTVPARFLGGTAPLPAGPWILAAALECPVFLLSCLREGAGYTVRLERFAERVVLPRQERTTALADYAGRYARRLERDVLRCPMQWYNFYEYWPAPRTLPPA